MELIFLGDIMFGWKIREKMAKYGHAYPFSAIPVPLSKSGMVIGNLETVVSDTDMQAIRLKNDKIVSPAECINSLINAGIQYVSVANNHVFDYGREGLLETLHNLEKSRMNYFGAGKTFDEANAWHLIHHHEMTTGILARTFTCEAANSGFERNEPQAAELVRPALLDAVKLARGSFDLLVVVLHFGFEYCHYPNSDDVQFCRSLIDRGANLVIGHHPHVMQGIEKYKEGLIAYSLGNFLFDNAEEENPDTSESLLLRITAEKDQSGRLTIDYNVEPTIISENGQVIFAKDEKKAALLNKIDEFSGKLRLNDEDYKAFSDSVNSGIVMMIRKKEMIRYLKKGNILYLLKKTKNIKWIHVRLFFNYLKRWLTRK